VYLAVTRRFDEAIRQAELARELDPVSAITAWMVPWTYFAAEQFDRSIDGFLQIRRRFPGLNMTHSFLGVDYAALGRAPLAMSECAEALSHSQDPKTLGLCGWIYAKVREDRKARKILERLLGMSEKELTDPFNIAAVYEALGDEERAMDWLEETYEGRFPSTVSINIGPHGAIRDNARYKALIARIGFPNP